MYGFDNTRIKEIFFEQLRIARRVIGIMENLKKDAGMPYYDVGNLITADRSMDSTNNINLFDVADALGKRPIE